MLQESKVGSAKAEASKPEAQVSKLDAVSTSAAHDGETDWAGVATAFDATLDATLDDTLDDTLDEAALDGGSMPVDDGHC